MKTKTITSAGNVKEDDPIVESLIEVVAEIVSYLEGWGLELLPLIVTFKLYLEISI